MPSHSVLIIDRNNDHGKSLSKLISAWGYHPIVSNDVNTALKIVNEQTPTIVIDDGSTAASEHLSFVRDMRLRGAITPVVVLTDHDAFKHVDESQHQEDVFYYLEKPVNPQTLKLVVDSAIDLEVTRRENELLRRQLQDRGAFGDLVGSSDP